MWELIKKYPLAVGISVIGHIVLLLAFVLVFRTPDEPAVGAGEPEPIKAVAVDKKLVEQEVEKRRQAELDAQKKAEAEKRAREQELKALEDKRKAEEQKLKQAEQQRIAAEKARAEEEKRQQTEAEMQRKAEEAHKKAEAEKQRKQEEARKQAEAEKQRKAEEARKKAEAEAEKKRAAEEARKKAEAEQQRKAEEARKQAEAERVASLEKALAAEEAELADRAEQRRVLTLKGQYQSTLRSTVSSNWIQPSNLPEGAQCEVTVYQAPGGFILDVRVERCSGGGEAMRRSVELAVRKSEPLPAPPDPKLFDRELVFVFKPE